MSEAINLETCYLATDIHTIGGDESVGFAVFCRTDAGNNRLIAEVGPDTGGQIPWVNDGEITLRDGFHSSDGTDIIDYIRELIERYRMDGSGGGFETPITVGEG